MKTVVKKVITLETKRHDFDNEFAYIEIWSNSVLKDCYFVEKEFLYPDGTIKNGGIKYFFCSSEYENEKEIKPIKCSNFSGFDELYFYNQNGEIVNIRKQ